jgi:hypothetical protein
MHGAVCVLFVRAHVVGAFVCPLSRECLLGPVVATLPWYRHNAHAQARTPPAAMHRAASHRHVVPKLGQMLMPGSSLDLQSSLFADQDAGVWSDVPGKHFLVRACFLRRWRTSRQGRHRRRRERHRSRDGRRRGRRRGGGQENAGCVVKETGDFS